MCVCVAAVEASLEANKQKDVAQQISSPDNIKRRLAFYSSTATVPFPALWSALQTVDNVCDPLILSHCQGHRRRPLGHV